MSATLPPSEPDARTGSDAQIVHVVDDDPALRVALDSLLRSVGYAVMVFASASEFVASGRLDRPGCLLLDVRMPGASGLDLQRQLLAGGTAMPIVLMSGHGDVPMSVGAMKAGAVDFLQKPMRDQDLLDAIAIALDRDRCTRARLRRVSELERLWSTLSPRERQVLEAVVEGRLNKQIAFTLGVTEITVKVHRSSGMRKLGVRSLAELVRMGNELGMLD
jgi:FixJ family two-component response regulator